MTITPQQLIALSPLLLVGLTVVVVMLSIAWRRNHVVNASLSVIGLGISLAALYWVGQTGPTDVTPLIRVDGYSMLYTGLVLTAGLATCLYGYAWLKGYSDNRDEFYLLVLIATLGGVLLASANHLASLFIGIELISLPLFGLVGYVFRQARSLEAAVKYMLLSAAASSFLLFGMALVYAGSGELSFASLGKSLGDQQLYQPLLLAGLGMMIVGIGFKLSLAPFHLWTPDVYQGAPAPVSTFLATASKIAIFGAVMRLFLYAPLVDGDSVRLALAVVAFVSIIVGNVMAVAQTNIKRLLGYSSIAHMGYLLVALIAVQSHELALETVGVYLVGYLFSSLGAFGVVSLISSPYRGADEDSLAAYRGLFWRRPVLAASMSVMMLSLAGIPMTLGFFGKFYVLAVSVNAQLWWLTAAVVVGSAIGLYYYLRAMVNLYLSKPPAQVSDQNEAAACPFSLGGVVVVLSAIVVVALGLYPQPLISLVQMAQPLM